MALIKDPLTGNWTMGATNANNNFGLLSSSQPNPQSNNTLTGNGGGSWGGGSTPTWHPPMSPVYSGQQTPPVKPPVQSGYQPPNVSDLNIKPPTTQPMAPQVPSQDSNSIYTKAIMDMLSNAQKGQQSIDDKYLNASNQLDIAKGTAEKAGLTMAMQSMNNPALQSTTGSSASGWESAFQPAVTNATDQLNAIGRVYGIQSDRFKEATAYATKLQEMQQQAEKDAQDTAYKNASLAETKRSNLASESKAAAGLTQGQMQSALSQIASQFDNEPAVRMYQTVAEGAKFAQSLPNDTKNPTDDQGLIYAFAKAMDPNSVVREGEYATVQKYSQSLINSYGKSISQAINGTGFLTADARANLKKTIAAKEAAAKLSYDNIYAGYKKKLADVEAGKATAGLVDYSQAYTQNAPETKQYQGHTYIKVNGGWQLQQ